MPSHGNHAHLQNPIQRVHNIFRFGTILKKKKKEEFFESNNIESKLHIIKDGTLLDFIVSREIELIV